MNDFGMKSAGTELNRMMDSLGFPDQVGDLYGAALDAAVGESAGVARNLLDAYSPLSTEQLDSVTRTMSPAASIAGPRTYFPANRASNVPGYDGPKPNAFPTPAQMQEIVSSILGRLRPENFAPVITQLTGTHFESGAQNLPDALAKTFEQLISILEGKIERKLDAEVQSPVGGKKKKKKGGLSKLKKSVSKFAKKTFKTVAKPLQKNLETYLKGLQKGNIFELGRALTGGLIGGPVSGFLLDHMMKLGGKKNPLQHVFKQVHGTFDFVQGLHQKQADLQRSLLPKILR